MSRTQADVEAVDVAVESVLEVGVGSGGNSEIGLLLAGCQELSLWNRTAGGKDRTARIDVV